MGRHDVVTNHRISSFSAREQLFFPLQPTIQTANHPKRLAGRQSLCDVFT